MQVNDEVNKNLRVLAQKEKKSNFSTESTLYIQVK